VDQHTLRDLSQHEGPPSACDLQPLVETLALSGGRLQAVCAERTASFTMAESGSSRSASSRCLQDPNCASACGLHDDRASPAADGRTAAPADPGNAYAQVTRIAPERPIH